jgi:hypothetical protein
VDGHRHYAVYDVRKPPHSLFTEFMLTPLQRICDKGQPCGPPHRHIAREASGVSPLERGLHVYMQNLGPLQ